MNKLSISYKVYFGLVVLLSALAALNLFLPQGDFLPVNIEQSMPASKPILAMVNAAIMFFVYGGLGLIGIQLGKKVGFADIIDPGITIRQRMLTPAIAGAGLGLFFIGSDLAFRNLHMLGPLPHPPFPTSIVASAIAGIGEEIVFRLFFISFWFWLFHHVILKRRWKQKVFWIVTFFSAVAFSMGHFPSVMMLFGVGKISEIPIALLIEMFLLNGTLSFVAAYFLQKNGFLAAVGVHFWTDIVWHVIWGLV
jgi:membrane protease YdiL (CAAX protease family)